MLMVQLKLQRVPSDAQQNVRSCVQLMCILVVSIPKYKNHHVSIICKGAGFRTWLESLLSTGLDKLPAPLSLVNQMMVTRV